MQKRISELRARGAVILGSGAVLKVLLVSLVLTIIGFIIVGLTV